MFIIEPTNIFFNKELSIPNLNEEYSETSVQLNDLIDRYVPFLLEEKVLGISLYSEFEQYIYNLDTLPPDPTSKWDKLLNGTTYTHNDKTYKWRGLVQVVSETQKHSLLAYYIFYMWLKDNQTFVGGVGEVRAETANAVNVQNNKRLVQAYNYFLNELQGGKDRHSELYTHRGVLIADYRGYGSSDFVDMYTFITHNSEDYPNAPLIKFNRINSFDL